MTDGDQPDEADAYNTSEQVARRIDDHSAPLNLQTQATDDLAPIIWYLKDGTLPTDNDTARKIILKLHN